MNAAIVVLALLGQAADAPVQTDGGVVALPALSGKHVSSCTVVPDGGVGAGCWFSMDDCIERARRNYQMRTDLEECREILNGYNAPVIESDTKGWSTLAVVAAFVVGIGGGFWLKDWLDGEKK